MAAINEHRLLRGYTPIGSAGGPPPGDPLLAVYQPLQPFDYSQLPQVTSDTRSLAVCREARLRAYRQQADVVPPDIGDQLVDWQEHTSSRYSIPATYPWWQKLLTWLVIRIAG